MRSFRKRDQLPKKAAPKVVVKIEEKKKKGRRPRTARVKPTVIGRALRRVGGLAGNYLGLGSRLGENIGAGVSRIFGQGDYTMPQRNSLMTNGVPSFSPLSSGFRVRHREYIQDIQSSIAFTSQSFSINPGLSSLFPWLSNVAQNFEQYKIHGMVVYLNTLSATAVSSTNTALGLWGVVTQYDPSEPAFDSKQQCENYVGCQTAVPSCSLIHGIECKPNVNVLDRFFVRSTDLTDVEDLKLYDIGKIQLFTQGSQAQSTIGEMWVSYDIEFSKPRLPTNENNFIASDEYWGTTATTATPLPISGFPIANSTLHTYTNANGDVIFFPANAPETNYIVTIRWIATTGSATVTAITPTAGGSLVLKSIQGSSSPNVQSSSQAPQAGSLLATRQILIVTLEKTSKALGNLNITGQTLATANNVEIFITQISGNLADKRKVLNRLTMTEIGKLRELLAIEEEKEEEKLQEPIKQVIIPLNPSSDDDMIICPTPLRKKKK